MIFVKSQRFFKKSKQGVIILPLPKLLLLLLFLEWYVQCQRAKKKCISSPSSKPNWKESKRKRKEHKLVAESRWLPPAPYGYLQMLVNDWNLQE